MLINKDLAHDRQLLITLEITWPLREGAIISSELPGSFCWLFGAAASAARQAQVRNHLNDYKSLIASSSSEPVE